ncbi:hypothetical protein [Phormidesmis priestleyi]
MNTNGRIFGGLLIAIATAWILNIAGVFPFSNRTTNQVATDADRTPVSDANAQRPDTQPGQGGGTNPLNPQQPPINSAQPDNANQNTSGTGTAPLDTNNPSNTGSSGATTSQTTPAIPAGW